MPPVTDLSALFSASRWASESFSATVTSALTSPLPARHQLAEIADHVAHREQPPVGRHEQQEIGGEPVDAGLGQHRGERLGLLLGAEHRAAHQPIEVIALGDQGVEPVEIGLHRIDRLAVERKLEQRPRIAASHAGYDRLFNCHVSALVMPNPQARRRLPIERRKPLDFKGVWLSRDRRRTPAKSRGCVTYRSLRCNMRDRAATGPKLPEFAAFRPFTERVPGRPAVGRYVTVKPSQWCACFCAPAEPASAAPRTPTRPRPKVSAGPAIRRSRTAPC